MKTRIIIADDHKIIREGLRSLIESETDMEVLAEAENGREAVDLAGRLHPDVVVMDIGMDNLNGVEATRLITEEMPGVKVIGLSMHADAQFVSRMLEAGASGYVLKDGAFEELVSGLRTVRDGRRYLSPGAADVIVEDWVEHLPAQDEPSAAELTPRERDVIELIATGKSTKETAKELGVSVKTIETHRHNIMHKLDLYSVAELTKYAIRRGLASLGD